MVEWDDADTLVLQVAESITGPWIDVPNGRAGYAIRIAAERGKFYRLVER